MLHVDRFIGREHCLDRPFEMDKLTVEILGFVVRELSGEGGYQYLE